MDARGNLCAINSNLSGCRWLAAAAIQSRNKNLKMNLHSHFSSASKHLPVCMGRNNPENFAPSAQIANG
jgi:predicted ribosome quality control (RQC) complex YloA/Tae2 family protein